MASNNRPEPSGHLRVANNPRRTPSPASSRVSVNPPTPGSPGPVDESAPDYFNPLSQAPSAQSQTSLASFPRLPSQTSLSAFPDVAPPPPRRPPVDQARLPSIRLRRTSNGSLYSDGGYSSGRHDEFDANRPRSISQPERGGLSEPPPVLARHSRRVPQVAMPRLTEEGARPSLAELGINDPTSPISPVVSLPDQTRPREGDAELSRLQRARRASRIFWPGHRRQADQKQAMRPQTAEEEEYAEELVDWLDVIDPEVQTLSTLTNVQNSLFVPDLGNWVNRRPTYALSRHDQPAAWAREAIAEEKRREAREAQEAREAAAREAAESLIPEQPPPIQRSSTITSRLTESHYAALPHGTTLDGWTADEKAELDDHVRHMLHSRRARFKRRMKGFG
ncbi:hypothetical protein FDECE_2083, partial [Fusarium decemcellulare]